MGGGEGGRGKRVDAELAEAVHGVIADLFLLVAGGGCFGVHARDLRKSGKGRAWRGKGD